MTYLFIALAAFFLGLKCGDVKNYVQDLRMEKKLDVLLKNRGFDGLPHMLRKEEKGE